MCDELFAGQVPTGRHAVTISEALTSHQRELELSRERRKNAKWEDLMPSDTDDDETAGVQTHSKLSLRQTVPFCLY